jgi:hypothetical protein
MKPLQQLILNLQVAPCMLQKGFSGQGTVVVDGAQISAEALVAPRAIRRALGRHGYSTGIACIKWASFLNNACFQNISMTFSRQTASLVR